ncbi:MAG: hypothetical protein OXU61_06560 [Gammaproteobacteria bacterium]|nr:hypothetical protein [Gammaproteobacteria bacterium]
MEVAEVVMVDLVVMVVLAEVVLEMVLATEGLIHFLNLKDRLAREVEVELLLIQVAVHLDIRVVLVLLLFDIK